ncbi:MAG: glycoside hydrolase family 3 N-terminal domain-containing protein [Coriobacteriales bacterium]|nr:glycoside hydrolase family 3 N-terminal domain-containing protein [Coriobacteriales bacterium]
MNNNVTRRTFLQSSAVVAALAGTACAQQSNSAASSASSTQPESAKGAQAVLDSMTTEQKVAQLIMPCFRTFGSGKKGEEGEDITDLSKFSALSEALRKHQYGGIILFGANVVDSEQTTRLVHALQENNAKGAGEQNATAVPYLVAADQEGGSVARVNMGTRGTGSMALGAIDGESDKYVYSTGEIFGQELSALGINLNLGPCVDIITDLADQGMSSRVFSDDPEKAGRLSRQFKSGMDVNNVATCFKHFPGAGDGSDDPTAIKISLEDLRKKGMASYKQVIDDGAEVVMTSATTFPEFDDTYTLADGKTKDCYPATMSPKIVTELLRKELGFNGVVITDALEMDQFFSAPETGAQIVPGERDSLESMVLIAQKCIEAGCDILLMPRDMNSAEVLEWYDGYIKGIAELVDKGTISKERIDESVLRILSLKEKHSLLDAYINGSDVEAAVKKAKEVVGSEDNHKAERGFAEMAITLVKNEGVFPLPADAGKVVIVGRRENADNPIRYALSELEKDGIFGSGLYVNDLIAAEKTGKEDAGTKVTVGSYYYLDDDGNASVKITDGILPAIEEADYVICESTIFSGIASLQDDSKSVQAITQLLEATHKAGARFILLSDEIPVEGTRYPDADAVVCAYLYAGFGIDPREDTKGANMGAINANVPAALRAMFGGGKGMPGKLPINVYALAKGADGSWAYTDEVAFARGTGLEIKA